MVYKETFFNLIYYDSLGNAVVTLLNNEKIPSFTNKLLLIDETFFYHIWIDK
jgi:hypothetical protein